MDEKIRLDFYEELRNNPLMQEVFQYVEEVHANAFDALVLEEQSDKASNIALGRYNAINDFKQFLNTLPDE